MKKLHLAFLIAALSILSCTYAQTAFRVEVSGKGEPVLLFPGFAFVEYGHSLGGTLGLWLAATEPTLFKKVIVVDALLQMDSAAFRAMAIQQTGAGGHLSGQEHDRENL